MPMRRRRQPLRHNLEITHLVNPHFLNPTPTPTPPSFPSSPHRILHTRISSAKQRVLDRRSHLRRILRQRHRLSKPKAPSPPSSPCSHPGATPKAAPSLVADISHEIFTSTPPARNGPHVYAIHDVAPGPRRRRTHNVTYSAWGATSPMTTSMISIARKEWKLYGGIKKPQTVCSFESAAEK